MYSVEQLVKGITNPKMVAWELNRAWHKLINESGFYDAGVDIFEESWDTLIILDACRRDEFERVSSLPGTTKSRYSKASMTREWVRANFLDRDLRDTVYITAINQLQHFPKTRQPELCEFIWPNDDSKLTQIGDMTTTPPELITEHAIKAHEKYPNKRVVVHYGQPHQPYLGESSMKFNWSGDFHQNIAGSDVTREEVFDAYRETLEIVLSKVWDLIQEIESGRIVVSADHGEMLGERQYPVPVRHYGHPNGIYVDELVEIPWHVYEKGGRRTVESAESGEMMESKQRELKQHLQNMGYI